MTVDAPAAAVFRWLCQLRVAPYSYDWIDNRGRQSPRELTPGLDELELGQRLMGFPLVEFEPDRHLTCVAKSRSFGDFAVTYLLVPSAANSCRLLMKILARYERTPLGWILRVLLPWGDLVMARRQLLNLKALAERDSQALVS